MENERYCFCGHTAEEHRIAVADPDLGVIVVCEGCESCQCGATHDGTDGAPVAHAYEEWKP